MHPIILINFSVFVYRREPVAMGRFIGQSSAFFQLLGELAEDADHVKTAGFSADSGKLRTGRVLANRNRIFD
jgi:hypothetical protein